MFLTQAMYMFKRKSFIKFVTFVIFFFSPNLSSLSVIIYLPLSLTNTHTLSYSNLFSVIIYLLFFFLSLSSHMRVWNCRICGDWKTCWSWKQRICCRLRSSRPRRCYEHMVRNYCSFVSLICNRKFLKVPWNSHCIFLCNMVVLLKCKFHTTVYINSHGIIMTHHYTMV